MKGITLLAYYYKLGVIPSFSRPRVSDDNPYIESFFKTVKYRCSYPHHFENLEHARTCFANFIHWYNYEHKHSGLQFVSPMQKHNGEHLLLYKNRNTVIMEVSFNLSPFIMWFYELIIIVKILAISARKVWNCYLQATYSFSCLVLLPSF